MWLRHTSRTAVASVMVAIVTTALGCSSATGIDGTEVQASATWTNGTISAVATLANASAEAITLSVRPCSYLVLTEPSSDEVVWNERFYDHRNGTKAKVCLATTRHLRLEPGERGSTPELTSEFQVDQLPNLIAGVLRVSLDIGIDGRELRVPTGLMISVP